MLCAAFVPVYVLKLLINKFIFSLDMCVGENLFFASTVALMKISLQGKD